MTRQSARLEGKVFDRLTVDSKTISKNKKIAWSCRCLCGKKIVVTTCDLRSGNTKSCGCLRQDNAKKGKHQHARVGAMSITYKSYTDMLTRCRNPNHVAWADYGGRGITVCDRWQNSFTFFLEDMGERPSKDYSIDRIDCNSGYTPENCRWADRKTQSRNKRSSRMIEFNGKTQSLTEWAEELRINVKTLTARLDAYGWTVDQALTGGVRKDLLIKSPSEAKYVPVKDFALQNKISVGGIHKAIREERSKVLGIEFEILRH
jgi:hypothetical protein